MTNATRTTYPGEMIYEYSGHTYRIWDQRQLGDDYLAHHGCSWCALATMINAICDSSIDPVSLRQLGGRLLESSSSQTSYTRLQRSLQRRPMMDLLKWSDRMPLNIAGALRILECYTRTDALDGASSEEIRAFLLAKAGQGIPVLATGRSIPSQSGTDLCPGITHTFLVIGQRDENTLIAADSSGSNPERIKYVNIDDLAYGVYPSGIQRGLRSRQYYYLPWIAGGLLAPVI